MPTTRRTFMAGLAALFGAHGVGGLRARIEDAGQPILLAPPQAEQTIYVYHHGILSLGSLDDYDSQDYRPTWREVLAVEGVAVDDPSSLALALRHRSMEAALLDRRVDDISWDMVEGGTWSPMARAERLLTGWGVAGERAGSGAVGGLVSHYGDNHPGSNDVWVGAEDDLSVSLLQARLIELKKPVRVVMEVESVEGWTSA